MNLAVDIGNSLVKTAYFNGNELVENKKMDFNLKGLENLLEEFHGRIIIASVKKDLFSDTFKANKNICFLDFKTKIPIINHYKTPESLGYDRLANAVAIHSISKGKNALAIDCGTCLKFDLVVDGAYEGGSISPGLSMRLKALHTFTDKLPLIKSENFERLNGMNTQESILSGCVRGMSAEIQQTLADYNKNFSDLEVFITGGDHHLFVDRIKNRIFADPFLTLKGLNEILNYQ